MVDTVRTVAELQALLADNTSGAISPQDLRDFLLSVKPPHGSFSMGSSVETNILGVNTYTKVAGVTVAGSHTYLMTAGTNQRLTYDGPTQRHFHLVASIAMTAAANNQTIAFRLAVNGVTLPETMIERRVGTGADIGALAIHGDAVLGPGDYVELWVANETSSANVTVNDLYVFAMGMIN